MALPLDPAEQLEALYVAEAPRLWRSILAYAGNASVADDAVAEAFAQLLQQWNKVRDPSRWIWRVAFRTASGELVSLGRHSISVPDRVLQPPEPLVDLLSAVRRLTERQRAVVILHDYADRPTREIADVLGISRSTVRVHLAQARRRLRAILEET